MTEVPLLDRVVEASGLAPMFAKSAIARAIKRSGGDPDRLTRKELAAALPELERTLQLYLDKATSAAMQRIEALTR